MKSIKEKAQEWADMYPSCGMADKSFEAGANYVLDVIEQYCNEHVICNSNIKHIIEQLKK